MDSNAAVTGIMGGMMIVSVIICIGFYAFFALILMTIANKTSTPNAWMAWIPILNIILMLSVAKKPMWWIILFFVPIANVVITILLWMAIAEARNKPSWWGVMIIVPVANIIFPALIAWMD